MRSKFSIAIVALAAASLTAACGGGSSSSGASGSGATTGGQLTFASYGGAFQSAQAAAWQQPFTAANQTTFNNTSPSDTAQIKVMVEAGRTTWDVADTSAFFATQYCGKYVEKIDKSVVDRSRFDPATVNDCVVPGERYGLLFVYNADKYAAHPPTKLADYFDPTAFPGRRGVVNEVNNGLLETGLLADGVPADQLYPLDVDRALKVYNRIKSQTSFAPNNGALQQLLADRQVDMGLIVSARAITTVRGGANLKPVWDKTVTNFNALVVPKGTPNKALAMKFIDFATQSAQSAKFAELSGTAPANVAAKPQFDETASAFNVFQSGRGENVQMSLDWWGKNFDATVRTFTTWISG